MKNGLMDRYSPVGEVTPCKTINTIRLIMSNKALFMKKYFQSRYSNQLNYNSTLKVSYHFRSVLIIGCNNFFIAHI